MGASMVDNFRRVPIGQHQQHDGHCHHAKLLYRCASLDGLAHFIKQKKWETRLVEDEAVPFMTNSLRVLLYDAGLILDLRAPNERKEDEARYWMSHAPGGSFRIVNPEEFETNVDNHNRDINGGRTPLQSQRVAMWIDVLSRDRLREYILQHWMPINKTQLLQQESLKELLYRRGLVGLNQAILAAGKSQLCQALRAVTLYWERFPQGVVVVHCVQGKDRTGMLIMLIQSICGASDADIIQEYALSDPSRQELSSSSIFVTSISPSINLGAANTKSSLMTAFSEAPLHVMKSTLEWMHGKYGSVDRYLDEIGFTTNWRQRLIRAVNSAEVLQAACSVTTTPNLDRHDDAFHRSKM